MVTSPVAGTKPDVDKVNTVCMNDGEQTGARVRTHIPSTMAKLYGLTSLSEATLLEKGSCPFLRTR